MLYSHDGVGLGHLRRNLAIAHALANGPATEVLLTTGVDEVNDFTIPGGVDVLKLPGIRKTANGNYEARHLADPDGGIHHLRQRLLTAAARAFAPDLLLADKHPTGADGELVGALEATRVRGGRNVLGLRDVIDDPAVVRREWGQAGLWAQVQEWHDLVLVYGQRTLLDPLADADCPPALHRRARYCGYVVNRPRPTVALRSTAEPTPPTPAHLVPTGAAAGNGAEQPLVMATAGAGSDGARILHAFMHASRGRPWRALAVAGPHADATDVTALRELATEVGGTVCDSVPELSRWLPHVGALVSMGGYNTLLEALAVGTPVVCVPRTHPRREQVVRARRFAGAGLLQVFEGDDLNPARMARQVEAALAIDRGELTTSVRRTLQLHGAETAAEFLHAEARHGARRGPQPAREWSA